MADGRHIENDFFGYILAPYWPINAKFGPEKRITCQYRNVTKTAIFENSRLRTAAILKIALYFSRELSDFDQIWYTYANFHSEHGHLTNIEIFQIQDGGRTPY